MIGKYKTKFAPAERASIEEIKKDAVYFARQPWVGYLVNAVPNVVLILNDKRQAVYANTALLEMLQLDNLQNALGQRPGELINCIHATETPGGCGTAEACQACGAVRAVLTALRGQKDVRECRITRPDNEALDLRVWTTPIETDDDTYVIVTIEDISNEKRRRVLERIFFHDITNTASVVSSYAQWLEITPEDTPILAKQIIGSTNHLIEEIQAQKDLMAAENGDLVSQVAELVPQYILMSVADQYQRHTLANNKTVRVIQQTDTLVTMYSDWTLLERVLGNMVKNALEASQAGQEVTLGYKIHDDDITFWVHNPNFMPRAVQLQVFQRSFSTKGKGRGLGTYSMKLLTEKYLGGNIWFESNDADGTTFFATYPLLWQDTH
jgi:signal transduction histidine kinase